MASGTRTVDLPLKTRLDEFLGNTDSGSGMETVRVHASSVIAQLAIGTGRAFGTWAALAATTGSFAGERAEVYGDAGMHTDPVAGGTVANSGIYGWSASPAGWRWLSADNLTAIQDEINLLAPIASPVFTGAPTAPTPAAADSSTKLATTAFVEGEIASKAPIASPVFTGAPTAPTPAAGDSSTRISTTSFVKSALDGLARYEIAFRPGDAPGLFSGSLYGAPASLPSLSSAAVVTGSEGRSYRIAGAATVASKVAMWSVSGRSYIFRAAYRRITNPSDPLNDAVRINVAWLDANYTFLSTQTFLTDSGCTVAAGVRLFSFALPTAPAGAVFARVYVETFGSDGVTDIEEIAYTDTTDLGGASALIYDGVWNASTNTPALASGVGVAGHYRIVSVAGATALDGVSSWSVGDWVAFNGTKWERVPAAFFSGSFTAGPGVSVAQSGANYTIGMNVPALPVNSSASDATTFSAPLYNSATARHEQVTLDKLPHLDNRPIVIFATGQSNMRQMPASTETWPSNLRLWNWDRTEAGIGTAFVPLDPTLTNVSWAFGREVAKRFPNKKVYIINIAWGGQGISHWLPGTTSPDVFQIILNNVPVALAAIGATQIDIQLWWQGESDAGAATGWVANAEAVQTRLKAESWFPFNTPTVVFGITSEATTGVASYGWFDSSVTAFVANDLDHRLYVRTSIYPQSPYWDMVSSFGLHMTAAGYNIAGLTAARRFLDGGGFAMNYSAANEYKWVGFGNYVPVGTFAPPSGFQYTNPQRGIVTSLLNDAAASNLGVQLSFSATGLSNWALGIDSDATWKLWSGRTSAADGTSQITVRSSGQVGLNGVAPSVGGPALTMGVSNPTRGIQQVISNPASSGNLGAAIGFSSTSIGTWVLGQDSDNTFSIWRSRSTTSDGTKYMSIGNGSGSFLVPMAVPAPSYTFSALPSASTMTNVVVRVSNVGPYGSFWHSDGTRWLPVNGQVTLAATSIAMIIPSSGTVGANGALTLTTALPTTFSNCYMYFPAGAVFAGSAAGLYYVVMSSTTAGTIYNNTYAIGAIPAIPASPTAVVDSGPGAYTQTTGAQINLAVITIVGGVMGLNGELVMSPRFAAPANTNSKTMGYNLNGALMIAQVLNTASQGSLWTTHSVRNRGAANSQEASPSNLSAGYGTATSSGVYTSIDTSVNQNATLYGNLSVATDYIILNGFTLNVFR